MRLVAVGVVVVCALTSPISLLGEENKPAHPSMVENDYDLVFCYQDMLSVQDFLKQNACVSGVHWQCRKETDTHWIGELHYPTENTGQYDQKKKNASPMYYMVFDLAIRKQEGLPINPKTYKGALVLKDPRPDVPLATRGDETSYEVVGYAKQDAKDGRYGFLFAKHPELKYQPPKKAD